ncbi:MAG: T9SS type A sorting domain-containing protein [Paludibacteraceae bacterium]|nr:T9SS type A sorting domain-containing protein [Paludibacteraceae bacterium]
MTNRILHLLICLTGCLQTPLLHAATPYVTQVFEYLPAPGQFTNVLPPYEEGDKAEDMARKALERIGGQAVGSTVSLGGFGGYIVVGFDHAIKNEPDEYDFRVNGNAYAGNAEPGVIAVMKDENENGLPDDTWYEIKGSAHDSAATINDYQITYYKPSAENDAASTSIESYIRWTDNQGGDGYLPKNSYHHQSYYPQWLTDNAYTLSGTRLPSNSHYDGNTWTLSAFDYGYADNWSNSSDASKIDIDWAVDDECNPAMLDEIHFIKIYCAEHQLCGWIGETSTEICGVEDLHPADGISEVSAPVLWVENPITDYLKISLTTDCTIKLYTIHGKPLRIIEATAPSFQADCSDLPSGLYLMEINQNIYKLIKQ